MAEPTSLDGTAELARDLAHLRGLLEREDVEGARAFVKELERRWPDSDRVRNYARVLAPPQVTIRRGEQGQPRHRERAWLRQHGREYPGCWLALLEDRLIAVDPDLSVVLLAVQKISDGQRPLIHFQPGAPD